MKKKFFYGNPNNEEEMTIFDYIFFLLFKAEKTSLIHHRYKVKLNPLSTYCISSGYSLQTYVLLEPTVLIRVRQIYMCFR